VIACEDVVVEVQAPTIFGLLGNLNFGGVIMGVWAFENSTCKSFPCEF
jgi:hypothetical protein